MTRSEISHLLSPLLPWRQKKEKKEQDKGTTSVNGADDAAAIQAANLGDTKRESYYPEDCFSDITQVFDEDSYRLSRLKLASGLDSIHPMYTLPDVYIETNGEADSNPNLASEASDAHRSQNAGTRPMLRHVKQYDDLRVHPLSPTMHSAYQRVSGSHINSYYSASNSDLSPSVAEGELDLQNKVESSLPSGDDELFSCSRFIDHLKTAAENALKYSERNDLSDTFEDDMLDPSENQLRNFENIRQTRRCSSSSDNTLLGSIYCQRNESEEMLNHITTQIPKIEDPYKLKGRRLRPVRLNLDKTSFQLVGSPSSPHSSTSPTSLISTASTVSTVSSLQTPETSALEDVLNIRPKSVNFSICSFSSKNRAYPEIDDAFPDYDANNESKITDCHSLFPFLDLVDYFESRTQHSFIAKMTTINSSNRNMIEPPLIKRHNKTLHFDATGCRGRNNFDSQELLTSQPQSGQQFLDSNIPSHDVKKKYPPVKAKCRYGLFPQV